VLLLKTTALPFSGEESVNIGGENNHYKKWRIEALRLLLQKRVHEPRQLF
jgi:hypothetical protein